jgi:hypothetical protein
MDAGKQSTQTVLRVFCSYAHEDHAFSRQLRTALAGLERLGVVESWSDADIGAGREWDKSVREELERADVIVFLVSYECCASDYVMEVEYPRAIERARAEGAEIIPLVVTEVDYKGTPFAKLDPRVKFKQTIRPIERWRPRRAAFAELSREIRQLAESRPVSSARAAPPSLPYGFWSPERRDVVVGRRGAIDAVSSALRDHGDAIVALVGNGGVGKTTIALEYTWQHAADYDLVAWLRAENPVTLAGDYVQMAKRLGIASTDQEGAKAGFRRWLEENDRWLIVFDNAADHTMMREYLPDAVGGHVVITSREHGWSDLATEIDVDRLPRDDAADLLRELTGDRDAVAAAELADLLEGRPLALQDAAAAVNETRISLRAYVDTNRPRLSAVQVP